MTRSPLPGLRPGDRTRNAAFGCRQLIVASWRNCFIRIGPSKTSAVLRCERVSAIDPLAPMEGSAVLTSVGLRIVIGSSTDGAVAVLRPLAEALLNPCLVGAGFIRLSLRHHSAH